MDWEILWMLLLIKVLLTDVNEPPVVNNQSLTVPEHAPYGHFVGNVIAGDPDNGQTLTYNIQAGNTNDAFYINSSNGKLFVNNSSALDYNTQEVFHLLIRVMDNGEGNLIDYGLITVTLLDIFDQDPDQQNDSVATGINALNENDRIQIFPNPADNYLNIHLENIGSPKVQISLTNDIGEIIGQFEEAAGSGSYNKKINVSGLSKGLYFVRIRNGNLTFVKKFIKH